jgi:hypothetical protein
LCSRRPKQIVATEFTRKFMQSSSAAPICSPAPSLATLTAYPGGIE